MWVIFSTETMVTAGLAGRIAEALQLLSEINNNQRVSERTGVPRSTLNWYRHFRLILP